MPGTFLTECTDCILTKFWINFVKFHWWWINGIHYYDVSVFLDLFQVVDLILMRLHSLSMLYILDFALSNNGLSLLNNHNLIRIIRLIFNVSRKCTFQFGKPSTIIASQWPTAEIEQCIRLARLPQPLTTALVEYKKKIWHIRSSRSGKPGTNEHESNWYPIPI